MKRIGLIGTTFIALAGMAFGDMDDKVFDQLSVTGTATAAQSIVLRGTLEAVVVDVTAPSTSTVTVAASDGRALFTLAGIAADAVYYPQAASHTTAGAAATFNSHWSTNTGVTSSEAQTWYVKQPMAGKITVTVLGQNAASVTNNTKVTLIYDR
jgi:hypothetical protein